MFRVQSPLDSDLALSARGGRLRRPAKTPPNEVGHKTVFVGPSIATTALHSQGRP
jgi:hypothetical protein